MGKKGGGEEGQLNTFFLCPDISSSRIVEVKEKFKETHVPVFKAATTIDRFFRTQQ